MKFTRNREPQITFVQHITEHISGETWKFSR